MYEIVLALQFISGVPSRAKRSPSTLRFDTLLSICFRPICRLLTFYPTLLIENPFFLFIAYIILLRHFISIVDSSHVNVSMHQKYDLMFCLSHFHRFETTRNRSIFKEPLEVFQQYLVLQKHHKTLAFRTLSSYTIFYESSSCQS